MKQKQHLVIILPESMADVPVRIMQGKGNREVLLSLKSDEISVSNECAERKYAFVWYQSSYQKIALDEIQWIEAYGSYSRIQLAGGRVLTLSLNLALIQRVLPGEEFIRVHRSYLVGLSHVSSMIGNSLRIGGKLLPVGRGYREHLFERIIFIGVRRNKVNS